MKKIAILFLFYLPIPSIGQTLSPFQANGLWGYRDSLGNTVIEPQYQNVRKFQGKYALVFQNDKWGSIDKQNNQIIPASFEYLKYMGFERFLFGYRSKYFGEYDMGVIDTGNNIIIPANYYNIKFEKGFFVVAKQSYEAIGTEDGSDIRKIYFQYGLMDSLGNVVLAPLYSRMTFLNNNFLIAELPTGYAVFDDNIERITNHEYMVVGDFHDGLSKVRKAELFGYINLAGKEWIECKYEMGSIFIDSLAIVRKNGKAGIINTRGEAVLDFTFQAVGFPYKGQVVAFNGLNYGMVDIIKGDTLLEFSFDERLSELKGVSAFRKGGKWQIWDYDDKKLLPQIYDELKLVEGGEAKVLGFGKVEPKKHAPSVVCARIKEKWGLVDEGGNVVLSIEYGLNELYEMLK